MHRDMLAKHIVVSNPQPCGGPLVLEVLRRFPDNAAREKSIPRSDACYPRQIDVRSNDAARAYLHCAIDDRIRPYFNCRV